MVEADREFALSVSAAVHPAMVADTDIPTSAVVIFLVRGVMRLRAFPLGSGQQAVR
ncbi:hypothetical protein ABT009_21820 [Streptomyces sp. NPDC002896]|uniref:hypothetical protein n=1 Tax=Streptomyces sp. NPDC002896 TaxID=3154438 RepID=UPI00332C00E1